MELPTSVLGNGGGGLQKPSQGPGRPSPGARFKAAGARLQSSFSEFAVSMPKPMTAARALLWLLSLVAFSLLASVDRTREAVPAAAAPGESATTRFQISGTTFEVTAVAGEREEMFYLGNPDNFLLSAEVLLWLFSTGWCTLALLTGPLKMDFAWMHEHKLFLHQAEVVSDLLLLQLLYGACCVATSVYEPCFERPDQMPRSCEKVKGSVVVGWICVGLVGVVCGKHLKPALARTPQLPGAAGDAQV